MEDNWDMKKRWKGNDLYSTAKPGSLGKQWWENSHNSFILGASHLLGILLRISQFCLFICDGGCVYFVVVKRVIFWLVVFLSMYLLTPTTSALGFMLFQHSKIVFPGSWCSWWQKKMIKGSFVCVDVVLNENATLFQLEKGKRKAVKHAFAQCLGEESPLLPSQDPNQFLRKNSGRPVSCACLGDEDRWGKCFTNNFIRITGILGGRVLRMEGGRTDWKSFQISPAVTLIFGGCWIVHSGYAKEICWITYRISQENIVVLSSWETFRAEHQLILSVEWKYHSCRILRGQDNNFWKLYHAHFILNDDFVLCSFTWVVARRARFGFVNKAAGTQRRSSRGGKGQSKSLNTGLRDSWCSFLYVRAAWQRTGRCCY